MGDVVKALSDVSGLRKKEIKQIWENVKANHKRLDECEGPHEFELVGEDRPLKSKYRCRKCKGELDRINHGWYQRGLEHGKK